MREFYLQAGTPCPEMVIMNLKLRKTQLMFFFFLQKLKMFLRKILMKILIVMRISIASILNFQTIIRKLSSVNGIQIFPLHYFFLQNSHALFSSETSGYEMFNIN